MPIEIIGSPCSRCGRRIVADYDGRPIIHSLEECINLLKIDADRRSEELGLVRQENVRLRRTLRSISSRYHTMRNTPMGTNRQERRIWQDMGADADKALGLDPLTSLDPTI